MGVSSHLDGFESDARYASHVCGRAGIACTVGAVQSWRVGGRELTVKLALDKRGVYVLFVFRGWPPELDKRKALFMAEVYGIALAARVRLFNGPTISRLRAMALIEAGHIDQPVRLAPLPEGAPPSAVATWDAIGKLAGARVVTGDDPLPMPLVASFLAMLTGATDDTIRYGVRWLEREHLIEHVGDAPGQVPDVPMKLWQVACVHHAGVMRHA